MKSHFARLSAIALLLVTALPLAAGAQTPAEVEAAKKKAAPPAAARPAPSPPAARPAPPPAAARPAPPPAAARPAPPPAARVAPPRPQPPAARIEPPRREAPAARIAPSQAPAAGAAPQRPERQRAVERPRRPDGVPAGADRARRNAPATPSSTATPRPAAPDAAQRAATPPPARVSPAQVRQQQQQERLLQRREDRALRALPPQQRAVRRQEIQQQRQQRTAQPQGVQPAARTGIVAQPNAAPANAPNARVSPLAAARVSRGPRRNGQARVDVQAARQGRFASSFAGSPQAANARAARAIARAAHVAPRRAWQSGRRASFVAWYGPVFYPYAYSDVFSYAFWPDGYDDDYWYVAYDDFFDGVYFGEAGQPEEYVGSIGSAPPRAAAAPSYKAVQDVCKQPGSGITAWPTAEIESKVGLNAEQKQLLGDVKAAGAKAASVFRATCPSENAFPLTPTGRLASMTARLGATLEAVQTVRPALETFYGSLNDEQKERFNAIGPAKAATSTEARDALPDDAKKCGDAKPGLTNLPIEQIEDTLKPNEAQLAELDKLAEATVKAVGVLQNACPAETPLTPPGRLQAIETRLQAMVEAANTVKPPLDSFYASLNAEQKARFNRLGRELTQASAQTSN